MGSGFPKSYNIEKKFRKEGKEKLADKWEGFQSALKPAHEPILLAQKPRLQSNKVTVKINQDNLEQFVCGCDNNETKS